MRVAEVGSEDFEIRVLRDEDISSAVSEADVIVGLEHMQGSKYGYALANGTIGAYDGTKRLWRTKSKSRASAISSFDVDGDGLPELLCGWSNGKVYSQIIKKETSCCRDHRPICAFQTAL